MRFPRNVENNPPTAAAWIRRSTLVSGLLVLLAASAWADDGAKSQAQNQPQSQAQIQAQQIEQLRVMVLRLQDRVDSLEQQITAQRVNARQLDERRQAEAPASAPVAPPQLVTVGLAANMPAAAATSPTVIAANVPSPPPVPVQPVRQAPQPEAQPQPHAPPLASVLPANLPGGATLNYLFDGYYEFNFNQPPGRVNYLRAYDVLSNVFSISQAALVLDWEPDVSHNRRYGARLDLQFGQATETLQGNPANEPRPDIYRNIYQAYGTYVVPLGSGLNFDFGKWASSLGSEGNYSKDQINYTRSYWFYFLPFYHQGVRASYTFNDKIKGNYWLVNGTNQSEPTNGYKDEMFGFVLTPTKSITWTSNYYLGQEHPDSTAADNCTVPVQPGLCVAPIIPAPNGKLHIFDNYVAWQVTPKLLLQGEGDYVIQREWANAAPGESSAPSHVDGGAAYIQYQLTPKTSLATRAEYMSDPQGLFSGKGQALKEWTGTYKYNFGDGFDALLEYRIDWSNQPYFLTHTPGQLVQDQPTAALGLVWWYGGKQGAW